MTQGAYGVSEVFSLGVPTPAKKAPFSPLETFQSDRNVPAKYLSHATKTESSNSQSGKQNTYKLAFEI